MKMVAFRIGFKKWRHPKLLYVLMLLELPMTIPLLALFAIADPDTYRTNLWQDGFDNGFNSNPMQPIFNLVNGEPMVIPLVWSQFLTEYNVVISVLSIFFLITKSVMIVMGIMVPILSFFIHGILMVLYAYSVHGQTSPDTLDPEHPNYGPPWFIKYSCSVTKLQQNVGYCEQAKASFYLTVFMLALLCVYVIVAIHSMLFAPVPKPDGDDDDDDDKESAGSKGKEPEKEWEMVPIPATPGSAMFPMSPMTPRTRAFNALGGSGTGSSRAGGPGR